MEPKISKIRFQFHFEGQESFGPVFKEIDETSKEYKDLTINQRFFGYRAERDYNNVYQVDIPYNPRPVKRKQYKNEGGKGFPMWAQWLIIAIAAFSVIALTVYFWSEIDQMLENLFNLFNKWFPL